MAAETADIAIRVKRVSNVRALRLAETVAIPVRVVAFEGRVVPVRVEVGAELV